MSFTPAKFVTSSQQEVHENLSSTLKKHFENPYQKPIAEHTCKAFLKVRERYLSLGKPPLILDSACGTGESTRYFASRYPGHLVIGLDQSGKRLAHAENRTLPNNALLQQCDCTDFWRLAEAEAIVFEKHYLLYPNPYPKSKHLQRRWHGHPAFPALVAISQSIELRSNWKIYAEEFFQALQLANRMGRLSPCEAKEPITAFERKYQKSGHELWQVCSTSVPLNYRWFS